MNPEIRSYEVEVEEVHSGDDLILLVNLGVDGLYKRVRARLRGVDTPSAFRAGRGTEAGEVREMLKALCRGRCRIELHAQGKGGWLVTLLVVDREGQVLTNVNDTLIAKGYVYSGKQETA